MNQTANFAEETEDPIAEAAALWTMRHDRGLTATEQDEFSAWLAADERHRAAWAVHRWGWDELDRLIGLQTSVHALPDPDLLVQRSRRKPAQIIRFASVALAMAAAIALAFVLIRPGNGSGLSTAALAAPMDKPTLEDGSVVTLNRGSEMVVEFTATERRVRLVKGEANFEVAKNKERPFIVTAGGVEVRAVGTAFNVRLGASAVEVLVTEGRVAVAQAAPDLAVVATVAPPPAPEVYLDANQHTRVQLTAEAPPAQVATLTETDVAARLAWQPKQLDFTDAPLGDIVAEFNRRNVVRLALGDPDLAEVRLSSIFRSDNVEGFVRLMESDFAMRAEWGDGEIVLKRR